MDMQSPESEPAEGVNRMSGNDRHAIEMNEEVERGD
jgi:hypothetical protein